MKPRKLMKVSTILSLILLGSSLTLGASAYAKNGVSGGGVPPVPPVPVGGAGGTAKPPAKNLPSPQFAPTLSSPLPQGTPIAPGSGQTAFSAPFDAINGAGVHGFDSIGIIQNATLDQDSLNGHTVNCSGSVTVDSKNFTIPCGLIVQMPANTVTWKDFLTSIPNGITRGLEIHLVGNQVGGVNIAALAFISQQSIHGLSGYITSINYENGTFVVDNATTLQINDPFGRFGRAYTPDSRFSVDDQNPTIHAGTGYPMCIPRTRVDLGVDDPLCPQKNRPLALGGCRNFGASGFAPPVSGELTPPAVALGQQYCSQYVMKAVPGTIVYPTNVAVAGLFAMSSANDADPRIQAPFEVGDFINYSGTILSNGVVSVHTIDASVGIFTQPGTQPSYIAIGQFGIGTADPTPAVAGVAAIEGTNRLVLEAEVTDFRTPIDIYLVDDAVGGVIPGIVNRWVTPWEMTGECPPANGLPAASGGNAPLATACNGVTGGISTSLTGPQAQRDRIRAVKAPFNLVSQPSRTVRVIARSLCTPTAAGNGGPGVVDACINAALAKAAIPANAITTANGLAAGQYLAPNFGFIFPENVKQGDIIIPNDLWHLPFLRFGESNGTPALSPQPW